MAIISFTQRSPIQTPFLALLRQNEDQGLRLIHGLCNHSISIWRSSRSRRSYRQPVTPLPIQVNFPWGRQSLWGDNQVYLWFRGYWGNNAVKSALMALEQWAIERVEGARNSSNIFQKVIQGNNTVAALGIGVSLCLAFQPRRSLHQYRSLRVPTCGSGTSDGFFRIAANCRQMKWATGIGTGCTSRQYAT